MKTAVLLGAGGLGCPAALALAESQADLRLIIVDPAFLQTSGGPPNFKAEIGTKVKVADPMSGRSRVASVAATGRHPSRAGDISFNNLGLSTLFMLSSNVPSDVREQRGLYAVGGCGGNIEWHTEADELDV